MGEVGEISDELMAQETIDSQDILEASGSGATSSEKIDIDGYIINYRETVPIVWRPFSSKSWRTRLKRVKKNLSSEEASETIDKPSSSGSPRRYSYAYPGHFRSTSPEVTPKIEPQDLLEIAGSVSQAFKDVAAEMKKREEARSSSKKGKKSSVVEPPTPVTKQVSAKKRSREREEKSLSKETSRARDQEEKSQSKEKIKDRDRDEKSHLERSRGRDREKSQSKEIIRSKDREEEPQSKERSRGRDREEEPQSRERSRGKDREEKSQSKERSRKNSRETLIASKKATREKEKTKSPERKEPNGEKSQPSSNAKRSVSQSPERPTSVHDAVQEIPKSAKKTSSSVNIKGWSEEQIIEHFDLKEFTIDISDFPHNELQPSTSTEAGEGSSKKVNQMGFDEAKVEQEKEKENVDMEVEGHKSRKRKRSASSSSSSCSCVSSAGKDKNSLNDSDGERNVQAKGTGKKKSHSERPCVECGRWLDDCVMDWKETLGMASVWCSRDCIERRVARAHEVLPEGYGALTLLRGDGQLLTTGPTLVNLTEFIYKYPEYEPVLPVAKKKQPVKNDQGVDSKKSSPKVLSKDSDRIRFNVKRAFSDALMRRAKMDKVKSAIKLCKDVAENIEAALFKSCQSNLNSPRYKSWTKTFIENVADCRNKSFYHRVLMGTISVHKVVTLEGEDMKKPEYSAPLEGEADEEAKVVESSDADVPSTSEANYGGKLSEEVERKESLKRSSGEGTSGAVASASETTAATRSVSKKEVSTPTKSSKKPDVKSGKRPQRKPESSKAASSSVSTLDSILGDGAKDTTEQHLSHFYDVNCSICLAKQKSQAEQERKEREEKEKQRLEEKRFREMHPVEKCLAYTRKEPLTLVDSDYRTSIGQSYDEAKRLRSPESTGAACASDEEYAGSYSGCPIEDSPVFRDTYDALDVEPRRDPTSWRNISSQEPVWSSATSVWNGQICMNNVMMSTSLCLISNPIAYRVASKLPPLLRIRGRIVPVIVFDYVHETVKNGEHHVTVLRLTRPVDLEGEQRYISIYEDMVRKGRYFAVDVPTDSCFKDIYLLPLAADEDPPAFLLPFDGPGIPLRHPPMIICVIVIYGSGRYQQLGAEKTYSKETILSRSPQDQQFLAQSAVIMSRSHSTTPKYGPIPLEYDNISPEPIRQVGSRDPLQLCSESEQAVIEDDYSPRSNPPTVLPESLAISDAKTVDPHLGPPSESGSCTPSDPPQIDYAPVGDADNLLPSKFFTMCKEAAKEPPKVPSVDEIDTLPDLLVFIQLNSNPREIKEVVSRFMLNPTLSENDRDLIRKKVMEKISAEKKKRSQYRRVGESTEEENVRDVSKEGGAKKEINNSEEMINMDSIDFESLNKLSSFVGEGAHELLKQAGEDVESKVGQRPTSPMPPPAVRSFSDRDKMESPVKDIGKVMKGGDQKAISEILPGPPPVPPVYGDDSSEGDSPTEHDVCKAAESSSFSQFQPVNVLPVPPPPPVLPNQLNIAVPPPPPPPPPPPRSEESGVDVTPLKESAPTTQALSAPPPPPPPTFGTTSNNAQSQVPHPPIPPGMFRPPIPMMMPPGLPAPPPFMNGPPANLSGIPMPQTMTMMSGSVPRPMPPPPGMSMPPPTVAHLPPPPGLMSHGLGQQHTEQKSFFPCTPPVRPSAGTVPPPQIRRLDPQRSLTSPASGNMPNQSLPGFPKPAVPYMGELAPLPSQFAHTDNSRRPFAPGSMAPFARPNAEDNVTRTPTPPSPSQVYHEPGTRRMAPRNGPRTPSPDISKKQRDAEIERLKRDIEEQKRRAALQAKAEPSKISENCAAQGDAKGDESKAEESLSWNNQSDESQSKQSGLPLAVQEPSSSQGKSDNDAMDIDGGESEEEHVDTFSGDRSSAIDGGQYWNEWTANTGGPSGFVPGHSRPFGRPPMPPPGLHGRGSFPGPPRGIPSLPGRGGFMTPPPHKNDNGFAARAQCGGFFSAPPTRGVRGAPNLRRGLPMAGRGGVGFPPPTTPLSVFRGRGRGSFFGGFPGAPRGNPPFRAPYRGFPPSGRPRGGFGPPK